MKRSHDSCQSPLLLSDINVPEKPKKKSCEVTTADFQSWSEQWGLCRSVKVNCQTSWNCRVTWRQLACFTSIVQPSVGSRCNTVLSPRLMDHLFRHSTENTHVSVCQIHFCCWCMWDSQRFSVVVIVLLTSQRWTALFNSVNVVGKPTQNYSTSYSSTAPLPPLPQPRYFTVMFEITLNT